MLEFNQAKFDAFCAEHKIAEYPPWIIYPPRGNYYHNSQVVVNNTPIALLLIGDDWVRDFEASTYFQGLGNVLKRGGANNTLSDVCTRFAADCLQLKPQTAVLCAGYHDVKNFFNAHAEDERIGEAETLAFIGKLRFQFRDLLKQAQKANQTLWLASVPPIPGCAAENELICRLNGAISALCQEFDTKYVDFYSSILDADNGAFCAEYDYPNVKTYNAVYTALCQELDVTPRALHVDEEEFINFYQNPDGGLTENGAGRRAEFNRKNSQIVLNHFPVDILFIGDSITEQYDTNSYFRHCGTVINRGYGGEQMQQLIHRFRADCLALKPRLAILAAGINDTLPFYQKMARGEEVTETDKKKYLIDTAIAYRAALEQAKAAGIPLWIATVLPLGTKDFRTDFLMALNERIKLLCREYGTVCLDYHATMIQADGRTFLRDMHFGDDLHPHVKGYNVLADLLKRQLRKENFFMTVEERLEGLELEDLVGQTLCYEIYDSDDPARIENVFKNMRPGGIFLSKMPAEKVKMYTDMANKYTKLPVIVASDVETGPECMIDGTGRLPFPMAWGASDSPELVEEAGRLTGMICRKYGIHWTYAPVVDINFNFQNPESNIRSVSDSPKHVVKIMKAYMQGLQTNGYIAAGIKHFPGQGMDVRNSHFCTTINNMTKEEWMDTYGYVYKEMIKAGARSIMIGHGALPCYEEENDPFFGPPPAVMSKSMMTDLLKGELGFDGCLVSDAMSMIGVASRVDNMEDVAVNYLLAGGDMVLFPEPNDYANILAAVKSGRLPLERLKDAVIRILRLKESVRLFEDQAPIDEALKDVNDVHEIAQAIADKAIKVVRNVNGVLPVQMPKGSRVLMLNMFEPHFHKPAVGDEFTPMRKAFEDRGYFVDEIHTAQFDEVQKIMDNYELICLNCKMGPSDYHGATMRLGWNNIMVLWRGYVLHHKRVVFTSFGDPYKLFDMPYLKEYINAFSSDAATQRAVVKVILGEIEPQGKNPVRLEGFFEREVD